MTINIINLIEEYINSDRERAIMVDGEWGSGKTYFIKNNLIPHLNSIKESTGSDKPKQPVIYISLYGHDNLESITTAIYNGMLMDEMGKKYNVLPYAEKLFSIIEKSSSIGSLIASLSPDKDFFSKFLSGEKKYTLIFDDFERANINYDEIMALSIIFAKTLFTKLLLLQMKEKSEHFSNKETFH